MNFGAIFFDVDDVILNTEQAHEVAVGAIDIGDRVQETFRHLRGVLLDQLRSRDNSESARLDADIRRWQRTLSETKVFSREVMIAIALERTGRPVTRAAVHEAGDAYWQALTTVSQVFPDALQAVERLREQETRFSFATGSDGFLELDENAQTFAYDPAESHRRKLARLEVMRTIGIDNRQITIGDPIGKPHPGFYEQVLADFAAFYGATPDLATSVAVGDSLTSDVLPFLAKGVAFGAWVQRDRQEEPAFLDQHSSVAVIKDLSELWRIKWPV